jgi:hypothetical protein
MLARATFDSSSPSSYSISYVPSWMHKTSRGMGRKGGGGGGQQRDFRSPPNFNDVAPPFKPVSMQVTILVLPLNGSYGLGRGGGLIKTLKDSNIAAHACAGAYLDTIHRPRRRAPQQRHRHGPEHSLHCSRPVDTVSCRSSQVQNPVKSFCNFITLRVVKQQCFT